MFDAVLLDLDGTVLDTGELILASWRHVRDRFGLAGTDDEFRRGMGRPLLDVLGRFARPDAPAERLVEVYREHNLAVHDDVVRPFPGIPEALDALRARGVRLAVVTSKHRAVAERGLRVTGIAVDALVGPLDAARPKPAPDPVVHALALLGADAAGAVMVGDSPHDIEAGRAAGVRTAGVAWGMFPEAELRAAEPDLWLDTPAAIGRLGG